MHLNLTEENYNPDKYKITGPKYIKNMSIWGIHLPFFPKELISHQKNLQSLSLRGDNIETFPANLFDGNPNLSELFLYFPLKKLPRGIYSHLMGLYGLVISDSNLQEFPYQDLNSLTNLSYLSIAGEELSSNMIEKIDERMQALGRIRGVEFEKQCITYKNGFEWFTDQRLKSN